MVEDEDYANGKTSQKDLQMRDDHAEAEANICLEGFGYAKRGKRWCDQSILWVWRTTWVVGPNLRSWKWGRDEIGYEDAMYIENFEGILFESILNYCSEIERTEVIRWGLRAYRK